MRYDRVWTVVRLDLRRLFKSPDYWVPMSLIALLFFVFVPWVLLSIITGAIGNDLISQVGDVLAALPGPALQNVQGASPQAQAAYSFAVFMLAPVAIVVPLTISSAVGAQTIVGERERGTGEFLAHSPLTEKEIYIGKLIASLIPGYIATLGGFALYSLIVNARVGPLLGGWFFPTTGWWILILWVVPPFIAISLSVILWVSSRVKSTAAAQQAASLVSIPIILISYVVTSGLIFDPTRAALVIGAFSWIAAGIGLTLGSRALQRERLLGVAVDG